MWPCRPNVSSNPLVRGLSSAAFQTKAATVRLGCISKVLHRLQTDSAALVGLSNAQLPRLASVMSRVRKDGSIFNPLGNFNSLAGIGISLFFWRCYDNKCGI